MSIIEKIRGLPRAALVGFIAPLIALVCIVLAVAISPSFDWVTNALSDLGHYTRTDIGPNPLVRAIIFNAGLATTGVLLIIITLGFLKQINDWPTRIAMLPFLIAAGFLTAIGIFSENFNPIHFTVSVGLFITFPFAMWFVGLSWLRYRHLWWFCVISLLLPFFSVYIWWGTLNGVLPWSGMAIPEILTAMTAILWIWIFLTLEVQGKLSHLVTHSE
ncbi:MAG: hypothetical protein AM326_02205 [Candidatus Thorarchaeota archaeon SMTZ-45]|nr:MAG: hypothetical protein AM326_02205 [Candidatus Thorarchaeota archaeon SMTZ-45]